MSFAINPSLKHIDISESSVQELYRSTAEVLLPDARFHGHTCEAYICIAKIEKTVKAYIGLLETEIKTVFVYTSDYEVSDPAEYPQVYAQAEAFLKKMGFVMEPVNLNFSPAMREVIIKGLRVMRPPPPPKKQNLRQAKPAPEADHRKLRMATPMPSLSPVEPETPGDFATELESLRRELASAKAVVTQITREKVSLEQSAAQKIASLTALYEQAVEAKRLADENINAEIELRLEKGSKTSTLDDEEKGALRADLEAVTEAAIAEKSRWQEEIASLQHRVAQFERDNLALEQQLAAAGTASAEQTRLLAEENAMLLSRIAAEESATIAVADKIATLELLETSWKEGQQREEDLCRSVDLLHNQLDAQAIELQTYKERALREEELHLRVDRLEEELAAAKEEIEIANSREVIPESVTAELQLLQNEKMAIETEYVRLANESREKELEMLNTITAAELEVERLSREMEIQAQVATMEHAALRAEMRRMVVSGATAGTAVPEDYPVSAPPPIAATARRERASAASPAVAPAAVVYAEPETSLPAEFPETAPLPKKPPVQPVEAQIEPEPPEEADNEPDRSIAVDKTIISSLMNEFGSFGGNSSNEPAEFSIDPSLTSIAYSDPEEIVALLYSSNTVQAVPDNSKIQRCKGYVVATKREELYKVYVAWYLTESKKVVICTPQDQPADIEECIGILQNAVGYFEIVGFMMEVEDLGESLSSYKKALKKIPVLHKTAPGA